MHLLPLNLAKIVDQTDSKNSTRFTLSAVHLRLHGDNTFIAEATDSKQLIRVTGNCVGNADEYPAHAGMDAAPNGSLEALVPGESWKAAFAMANKTAKRSSKPLLKSMAVKIGTEVATFGATNFDSYPVEQTRLVEGRFPPTSDIIGQTTKKAKFAFAVDPKILAGLLNTMASIVDDDNKRVEFHVSSPDKPVLVRHVGKDLKADGIIMPLAGGETETDEEPADVAETDRLKNEFAKVKATLEYKNRELVEERDALLAANAELAAKVRELRDRIGNFPQRDGVEVALAPARFLSRRERLEAAR